jgi:hypothetical protein
MIERNSLGWTARYRMSEALGMVGECKEARVKGRLARRWTAAGLFQNTSQWQQNYKGAVCEGKVPCNWSSGKG